MSQLGIYLRLGVVNTRTW